MSMATTSTADQKTAKLLERADQLEQDTDQAADRIRSEWRGEQERLQRDNNLTREAVTRLAHEQGDLAGARDLQERVLAASRRLLGEEHPFTLVAMSNLAVTHRCERVWVFLTLQPLGGLKRLCFQCAGARQSP
jgi:hypothetical protein